MIAVSFPAPLFAALRQGLLEETDVETCAVAFTRLVGHRLLVADVWFPAPEEYAERTRVSATLKPEYLLKVVNRARREGLGCIFAHSHPGDDRRPQFSRVDDAGERRIGAFLADRLPEARHIALVASPGGVRARLLGFDQPVLVQDVGEKLRTVFDPAPESKVDDRHDRQIRAFGREGQEAIGQLTVGIVGVGGTGSITCQQLAYLGVNRFVLIDFDKVETSNLNRLVGAGPHDVGQPKLDVAKRMVQQANPSAVVTVIPGDVADDVVAKELISADVIFLCTDSHASRAIVGQLAYQYLIPAIDMGVSLSVRGGELAYITGRVQLLSPGLPCFTCMELLNSETIRRELLTPEARAADPYIVGFHEPQPSVVSLNGTVASLAITMFIGLVTPAPVNARMQIYDGINGTVRNMVGQKDNDCFVCSPVGALARGNSWPLPTRRS